MIEISMYQPDIPQNVGAMMRLCACTGIKLNIIEPCGFPWNERKIAQAGMDYIKHVSIEKHISWEHYNKYRKKGSRIILMSAHASLPYTNFEFQDCDILLAGRESAGVPEDIHQSADALICIPMIGACRSLNIVNATSMILGEALRQTGK